MRIKGPSEGVSFPQGPSAPKKKTEGKVEKVAEQLKKGKENSPVPQPKKITANYVTNPKITQFHSRFDEFAKTIQRRGILSSQPLTAGVYDLILHNKEYLNEPDMTGKTVMQKAIEQGLSPIIEKLLANGVKINTKQLDLTIIQQNIRELTRMSKGIHLPFDYILAIYQNVNAPELKQALFKELQSLFSQYQADLNKPDGFRKNQTVLQKAQAAGAGDVVAELTARGAK